MRAEQKHRSQKNLQSKIKLPIVAESHIRIFKHRKIFGFAFQEVCQMLAKFSYHVDDTWAD